MINPVQLYTLPHCPHCTAAREDLEWRGVEFLEYDVARDPEARRRLLELTGGIAMVPVLVEAGRPPQAGWMGQGCPVMEVCDGGSR